MAEKHYHVWMRSRTEDVRECLVCRAVEPLEVCVCGHVKARHKKGGPCCVDALKKELAFEERAHGEMRLSVQFVRALIAELEELRADVAHCHANHVGLLGIGARIRYSAETIAAMKKILEGPSGVTYEVEPIPTAAATYSDADLQRLTGVASRIMAYQRPRAKDVAEAFFEAMGMRHE